MAALQQSTPPAPHRRAPPPLDREALLRRREAPPSCSMVGRTHSFDHNHHRVAPAAATSPPTVSPSAGSFTTSGALSSRASVGAAPIPSHRRAPPPPPAYASSTVRRDASVPPGDAPAPAMSCTTSHGTVTAARMTRIAHGYEAPRVRVPGSFCGIQAGAAAPYGMSACEGDDDGCSQCARLGDERGALGPPPTRSWAAMDARASADNRVWRGGVAVCWDGGAGRFVESGGSSGRECAGRE